VYQLQQQKVIPSFKAADFGGGLQSGMLAFEKHIEALHDAEKARWVNGSNVLYH
jgi:hypothetical protein